MASPDGAAGKSYQIFSEEIVLILHNLLQRTDADKRLHHSSYKTVRAWYQRQHKKEQQTLIYRDQKALSKTSVDISITLCLLWKKIPNKSNFENRRVYCGSQFIWRSSARGSDGRTVWTALVMASGARERRLITFESSENGIGWYTAKVCTPTNRIYPRFAKLVTLGHQSTIFSTNTQKATHLITMKLNFKVCDGF